VSRQAAVARGVAAILLVVVATVLVLLARDGWHWGRTMRDGDALIASGRGGPNVYRVDTTLPSSTVRNILGINDDVLFRQTELKAIELGKQGATALNLDPRILVETTLARMVRINPDHVHASIAANLLGVLIYQDRLAPQQAINPYGNPTGATKQSPQQRATEEFVTAVRLDPNNADAKANLEAMLEQISPPSQQGNARPGSGEHTTHHGSGSRPPGRGY
jgi:hypothetical protein